MERLARLAAFSLREENALVVELDRSGKAKRRAAVGERLLKVIEQIGNDETAPLNAGAPGCPCSQCEQHPFMQASRNRITAIEDVQRSPAAFQHCPLATMGVMRSVTCLPLVQDGHEQPIGFVAVLSDSPRDAAPTAAELDALGLVGSMAADTLVAEWEAAARVAGGADEGERPQERLPADPDPLLPAPAASETFAPPVEHATPTADCAPAAPEPVVSVAEGTVAPGAAAAAAMAAAGCVTELEPGAALRSASYAALVAESTLDMISVHDISNEGRYVYVSAACKKLLGYEPAELIGRPASSLFHPEEMPRLHEVHEEVSALAARSAGLAARFHAAPRRPPHPASAARLPTPPLRRHPRPKLCTATALRRPRGSSPMETMRLHPYASARPATE